MDPQRAASLCKSMLLIAFISGCARNAPGANTDVTSACPSGQVADEASCVPMNCGVGEYGDVPETDFTVGPRGAYLTIQDAADAAGAAGGGIVAIAAGTYAESATLGADHDGVTLAGRCADMVTIDASDFGKKGFAVHIEGRPKTETSLSGLTIVNTEHDGVRIWSGHSTLSSMRFRNVQDIALDVNRSGASATLTDLDIADAEPDADGVSGLLVRGGASVEATDLAVHEIPAPAVYVVDPHSHLVASNGRIENIAKDIHTDVGVGLVILNGATADVSAFDIGYTLGEAIYISDAGSLLTLSDSEVHDSAKAADDLQGWGAFVQYGGAMVSKGNRWQRDGLGIRAEFDCVVTVDGDEFLDNTFVGAVATGAGASVTVRDSLIDGVTFNSRQQLGGIGILAVEDGHVDVANTTVRNAVVSGFLAQGGGTMNAAGCISEENGTAMESPAYYSGAAAFDGGQLTMVDSDIRANIGTQVGAGGAGAVVSLTRSRIHDSDASGGFDNGMGVFVWNGATISLDQVAISHVHAAGAIAGTLGTLNLRDVTITDVLTRPNGYSGSGLAAQSGGVVRGENVSIKRAHEVGVVAYADGVVDLEHLHVADTLVNPGNGAGVGIAATQHGQLHVRNATITGSEGAGMFASFSDLACTDCVVDGARFAGVALTNSTARLDGLDVSNVTRDITYDGGVGIFGDSTSDVADVEATDFTIDATPYAAAWFQGKGVWNITNSVLVGGVGVEVRPELILHGNALFASGGAEATLSNVEARDARVALLLDGASADLSDVRFVNNALDMQVQACDAGGTTDIPNGATANVCPADSLMTRRFTYAIKFTEAVGESE